MRTEYFQSGRDITISYPVEINGIRTRVVEAGEGDEVLVCIHGVGSRADRFIPAMPDLTSQGYRVIAIDLPGHGFASKPPDFNYRPKEFAAFIGGVLDLLDLEGVTILGTSLGGQVAATLACDRYELVSRLILIGTMGIVPMKEEDMVPPEKVSDGSPEGVKAKLSMLLSSGSIVPNSWVREESMINTSVGAKEALYQAADALNEDSVGDLQLARLEVIRPSIPVLLVWGEDDSWTPIEMGFRAQQAIPRAELAVMKNCGHAPYFENPEEFAEIVRHFIDFEKKDEV